MMFNKEKTIQDVIDKLKVELSSHISVNIKSNPFNSKIVWVEVKRSPFYGIQIFINENDVIINGFVPNFFWRAFGGGLLGSIFYYYSQKEFRNQIRNFIILEFYND